MFTFYDDAFQEFYILGQVVNSSGSDQRIKALMPVVYDDNGDPVTDEESVDVPPDYEQMREAISLAPEQSFSFGFLVYLPRGFAFNNKYEILIESEPAEPARDDLEITKDDFDMTDWPSVFYVEGAYDNPGPDLDKHIAVVVTVYDDEMRVIGLDWFFGTDAGSLKSGEHGFEVEVDLWEIIGDLELEVHSYKVQVFGN